MGDKSTLNIEVEMRGHKPLPFDNFVDFIGHFFFLL